MAGSQKYEQIIKNAIEVCWGRGDLGGFNECYATDCVSHQALVGELKGEGIKEAIKTYHRAFPDMRIQLLDLCSDGDACAVRWRAEGTHRGDFLGAPGSGRRVVVEGCAFTRIRDDHIVEEWNTFDTVSLLQQVGIVPSLQAGEGTRARVQPS